MTLKQVRHTTSRDDAGTDIGRQQSGDSRHQVAVGHSNRRRLEDGRSSSNSKDTTRTMITDFALWRRIGRAAVVSAARRAKKLHFVPRCFALHCWGYWVCSHAIFIHS